MYINGPRPLSRPLAAHESTNDSHTLSAVLVVESLQAVAAHEVSRMAIAFLNPVQLWLREETIGNMRHLDNRRLA